MTIKCDLIHFHPKQEKLKKTPDEHLCARNSAEILFYLYKILQAGAVTILSGQHLDPWGSGPSQLTQGPPAVARTELIFELRSL